MLLDVAGHTHPTDFNIAVHMLPRARSPALQHGVHSARGLRACACVPCCRGSVRAKPLACSCLESPQCVGCRVDLAVPTTSSTPPHPHPSTPCSSRIICQPVRTTSVRVSTGFPSPCSHCIQHTVPSLPSSPRHTSPARMEQTKTMLTTNEMQRVYPALPCLVAAGVHPFHQPPPSSNVFRPRMASDGDDDEEHPPESSKRKKPNSRPGSHSPQPRPGKRRRADAGPRYVTTASKRKGKAAKETLGTHRLKQKDVPEGAESLKVCTCRPSFVLNSEPSTGGVLRGHVVHVGSQGLVRDTNPPSLRCHRRVQPSL